MFCIVIRQNACSAGMVSPLCDSFLFCSSVSGLELLAAADVSAKFKVPTNSCLHGRLIARAWFHFRCGFTQDHQTCLHRDRRTLISEGGRDGPLPPLALRLVHQGLTCQGRVSPANSAFRTALRAFERRSQDLDPQQIGGNASWDPANDSRHWASRRCGISVEVERLIEVRSMKVKVCKGAESHETRCCALGIVRRSRES